MLTDLALAPLQAVDRAGLKDEARKWDPGTSVRGAGAVYTNPTAGWGPWIPARLNPLSADEQLKADQPSAAFEGWMSVSSGTAITAGETWETRGTTGEEAWTRTVVVQAEDFPRSHELRRRVRVTGTASNP